MSEYNAYIIDFNKSGILDSFSDSVFHKQLTTAEGIVSWWHYLDSSYIIITHYNTTAKDVGDYIKQIMPKRRFIVLEVDLNNHDGYLPQKAWDWIKKYMY